MLSLVSLVKTSTAPSKSPPIGNREHGEWRRIGRYGEMGHQRRTKLSLKTFLTWNYLFHSLEYTHTDREKQKHINNRDKLEMSHPSLYSVLEAEKKSGQPLLPQVVCVPKILGTNTFSAAYFRSSTVVVRIWVESTTSSTAFIYQPHSYGQQSVGEFS